MAVAIVFSPVNQVTWIFEMGMLEKVDFHFF